MNRSTRIDADRFLHFGFGSRRVEPKRQSAFHRHSEIEFLIVEKGRLDQLTAGKLVQLHPGRLAVFWGAMPHAPVEIAPGTALHRLTVPLPWFLEWRLPRAFTRTILAGEVIIDHEGRQADADLALFARWHDDLADRSADRRKLVLLEAEARLRRLLLSSPRRGVRSEPARDLGRSGSGHVERMSHYVALHYTEPMRIADIARHAGLHADYAAVLFRKTCGLSLVDYVNEHRISHAQRLLATSDAKIVDIAYIVGFGSASRFYKVFSEVCACTPRRYRSEMGPAGEAALASE